MPSLSDVSRNSVCITVNNWFLSLAELSSVSEKVVCQTIWEVRSLGILLFLVHVTIFVAGSCVIPCLPLKQSNSSFQKESWEVNSHKGQSIYNPNMWLVRVIMSKILATMWYFSHMSLEDKSSVHWPELKLQFCVQTGS